MLILQADTKIYNYVCNDIQIANGYQYIRVIIEFLLGCPRSHTRACRAVTHPHVEALHPLEHTHTPIHTDNNHVYSYWFFCGESAAHTRPHTGKGAERGAKQKHTEAGATRALHARPPPGRWLEKREKTREPLCACLGAHEARMRMPNAPTCTVMVMGKGKERETKEGGISFFFNVCACATCCMQVVANSLAAQG